MISAYLFALLLLHVNEFKQIWNEQNKIVWGISCYVVEHRHKINLRLAQKHEALLANVKDIAEASLGPSLDKWRTLVPWPKPAWAVKFDLVRHKYFVNVEC